MDYKHYSGVRGNLSLVVDGLRCKRCDGTIQEADLPKDLVMDGETYGSVIWDILLMDMVDVDLAAIARIRNAWKKFREIMTFLKYSAPAQVYASCVRSSMIYRNETRPPAG